LARDSRGTKREDPETGKKFYDLNKDPIVSPYTGKSYPRSYFEQAGSRRGAADREEEQEDEEEVEAEEAPAEEEIPEVEDVEEVEDIGEDEADAFLEEDEEEDENLDFDVGGGDER
jgi:uncharacterized protein (TIGR02300 family)